MENGCKRIGVIVGDLFDRGFFAASVFAMISPYVLKIEARISGVVPGSRPVSSSISSARHS